MRPAPSVDSKKTDIAVPKAITRSRDASDAETLRRFKNWQCGRGHFVLQGMKTPRRRDQPSAISQRLGDLPGVVVGVSVGLPGPAAVGPPGLEVGNANVGDGDGDAAGDPPG